MRLLLDEHLPHTFRREIPAHDVFTVAYMGWSGVENGELLQKAAAAGFDAVITNDSGVEHEQNLDALPVAVIYLDLASNTLESLRAVLPDLLIRLNNLQPRQFVKLGH